jgi:hypothetical protein
MKIGLAIRELHRSEKSLARALLKAADRHHAEHEIHYVAKDLAAWSADHIRDLAGAGQRYGVKVGGQMPRSSGLLAPLRTGFSVVTGRQSAPGVLLLADLRRLHRMAAGVSLDWELLAQGAQAVKDSELVELTRRCHPETLRQLKWTNAMLKTLSPQVLVS